MMQDHSDDLPNNIVPPAMKASANKKVNNLADLARVLTVGDWEEICWLEEHVANIS